MTKKKSEQKDGAVIIATEENKIKFGGSGTGNAISEEHEEEEDEGSEEDNEPKESEDEEGSEEESEEEAKEKEDEETVKNMKKPTIKESTDHIIGIVSTGKLHLLEDGIMGVVKSKVREKIDEQKEQIRAKLVFKGE
jgi:hypothetical protein